MKKYMLFCFPTYTAGGGFGDFIGSFDSLQEAINYAYNHIETEGHDCEYSGQIVDAESGDVIMFLNYDHVWMSPD